MGSGSSISSDSSPQKLDWISSLPCFAHLAEAQLLKVVQKVSHLHYKQGDEIITQGVPGTLFGIIVSGEVKIFAEGPHGKPILLCEQKEGFFFGEAAIIGNTTTTASIIAKTKTTILGEK